MEKKSAIEGSSPRIKFKYIFSEGYNAKYATGVFGGVSPSGEIVANFFFERHALPTSQTHLVKPSGQLGDLIENEPADLQKTMVRVVENGIILNLKFAKKFREWLNENIEVAEKAIESDKDITG